MAAPPQAPPAASAGAAATPKVPLKPASDVVAGAVARALSQSTIHPLDTFKVRMQAAARGVTPAAAAPTNSVSKFGKLVPPQGTVDFRAMGAGVASLYKGVVGAASGAGIAIGAYFACYGLACNVISTRTSLTPSAVAFVAGGIAAAGSSVVKVPLAVCIRSVQAGVYPNVFVAASSITAAAGPRGLFTGYFPTLLEDVPDMAFKFAAYESMRQLHGRVNNGRKASPQEDFAMGAAAGALAAAATTPLDVIKTNMMCTAAQRPTMMGAARSILANGGPSALFTGVAARAVSNGINSAVFFCFFEALRGSFANRTATAEAIRAWGEQAKARVAAVPRHLALLPPAAATGVGGRGCVERRGSDYDTSGDESVEWVVAEGGGAARGRGMGRSMSLLAHASPLRLEDAKGLVMTVQALKSVDDLSE